jgi:hypothetical protein
MKVKGLAPGLVTESVLEWGLDRDLESGSEPEWELDSGSGQVPDWGSV